MAPTVERKLTTILCADVCGYSRQMGKDEEGTLNRLKKAREVFLSHVSDYSGRIVNMTGDGLVAEFGSVVQAVNCAVEIQNLFNKKNNGSSQTSEEMIFRIGLNLGDVIIEGTDIFGDGVNVAARLEAITPPGGICISGTVYDHVKGKLSNSFEFLGEKQVKNIEGAIPVYSLGLKHNIKKEPPHSAPSSISDIPSENKDVTDDEEQRLRQYVKKQASFYRRSLNMGVLILFLFFINILTSPGYFWVVWPALPVLFLIAMDAIRTFGKGQLSKDWEERKLEELKKRK